MQLLAGEMGNCFSTSSVICCKKRKHWPPALTCHERPCKRIKYAIVPQSNAGSNNNRNNHNTTTVNGDSNCSGSPRTLHRSNAIRRPRTASRSSSSTPNLSSPARLRVRNATPPPARPTSIVPTLMLNGTPSTGQTSLSRSTAPTSPTTVISSVHHPGNDRRTMLYMVDGEVIGSEAEGSPRLELRWIDALRAPGAGGYRTVVDVVEERRSGRLTVVNGNGRASLETVESRKNGEGRIANGSMDRFEPHHQQQQPKPPELTPRLQRTSGGSVIREQQPRDKDRPQLLTEAIQGTQPPSGRPTRRALEEEAREKQLQQPESPPPLPSPTEENHTQNDDTSKFQPATPVPRRKPVPNTPTKTHPVTLPSSNLPFSTSSTPPPPHPPHYDHQIYYQRRKAPLTRPPIPTFPFPAAKPTVSEFLEEVDDAKRILDGME
ncbi:MAG: hypothetical protein LQ338_007203, partial [Usnochroma carphineum]